MTRAPRFQQIQDHIRERIQSQQWPPGYRVPTEAELCRLFEVSRMTVSKALRDLVNEGLLERTPRVGTFVSHPKAESPLMDIRNIADEVRARGQEYSSQVISVAQVLADEEAAIRLGVMHNSTIYESAIVHYADNQAIQYEHRWVNPQHVPEYAQQDFSTLTPNEYLSTVKPLSAVEHTVEAVLAPEEICQWLAISSHSPCLLLHRRTWSDQQLISAALLYHPGSRYKLTARNDGA
ncbi:histidine utilization repressor [Thaumasiovibrio subtropicus]|uniref:histidine utilization repressor n=1 Tax=Thaumasiovibrio subtropicus TaxID=1891207 RepID=UPI000B3571F9|nr:histidine utilization repressor [Thaumasiovibrio subtropicus]